MVYTIIIVVIAAVTYLPVMITDSLNSLRYVCIIGFTTIFGILASLSIDLLYEFHNNQNYHVLITTQIRYGPKSMQDVILALPIISVMFICQSNILHIYSQLNHPSTEKMRKL